MLSLIVPTSNQKSLYLLFRYMSINVIVSADPSNLTNLIVYKTEIYYVLMIEQTS